MKARVCIVGSGVAGSVAAQGLMAAGWTDIIMVESGARVKMGDYRTWLDIVLRTPGIQESRDPSAAFTLPNVLAVPQFKPGCYAQEDVEETGDISLGFPYILLRIRGGTTVHFEGWSYRLKVEDFELKSRTGAGADWPFSYDHLAPYYERAEATMQVSGDASDTDHPPRTGPFPLPAFPFQKTDEPFLKGLAANGWTASHIVIARNTKAVNGMPSCQTVGTCQYCPLRARFTGDQLLDRLESRDGFQLLTETTALRFIPDGKRRIAALEVISQSSGQLDRIEADLFILAAGAIESPKMMLASDCAEWPGGPGNASGLVGRGLMNHPLVMATSRKPVPGHVPSETDFPTAFSRHFDTASEQGSGKFVIAHRAKGIDLRWHMMQGRSRDQIKSMLKQGWPVGQFLVMGEQWQDENNRVTLASGTTKWGSPRSRVHYGFGSQVQELHRRQQQTLAAMFRALDITDYETSAIMPAAHPMGTCRMGVDGGSGVVDPNLLVHGIDNLYVSGSSTFPSGGAGNPTLTIVALAHRLADHLAGKSMKRQPSSNLPSPASLV